MRLVVLGPQRRPTVDAVVRAREGDALLTTVTAGWQEREDDDDELTTLLGGRCLNLRLHSRWLDVQARDEELARAELEHRSVLDELQRLYVVQVDSALRAVYKVAQLASDRPRTHASVLDDALEVVRTVDEHHLARVRAAHADFYGAWRPQERPVVAEHRAAVHAALLESSGLVVAGGHVGVLLQVLHLFDVGASLPEVVVTWSAGAMALTERVVLFHDRAVHGPAHAEVYADGLGAIRGTVLLPHARRRLHVTDRLRMSVLARRAAPARCVVLDDGIRLDLGPDGEIVELGES